MDLTMMSDCLEACMTCAETCASCADACLGEQNLEMLKRCIRLNEDCRDICVTTAGILSRQTETDWTIVRDMITAAMDAARLCAEECEKHAQMHEHCAVCAQTCRQCEQSCNQMVKAMPLAA